MNGHEVSHHGTKQSPLKISGSTFQKLYPAMEKDIWDINGHEVSHHGPRQSPLIISASMFGKLYSIMGDDS